MLHAPYMYLQALPDFSSFRFTSMGDKALLTRQIRFISQKDTKIYTLDLCDLPPGAQREPAAQGEPGAKDDPAGVADTGDMHHVMATLIQVIEIYTARYPDRTVRLKGNSREKSRLYRDALDKHLDILCPLFTIDLETKVAGPNDRTIDTIAFLLKRKPIPFLTIHTVQTTWSGHSRLFGNKVHIDLNKGLRVGVALPAV